LRYLYLHPLNMDSSLVMQILFANEKAFENVKEKNECMKIYNICKLARENENIINTNNKNRAEIYSVRIFNCLKNNIPKDKSADALSLSCKFSKKFTQYVLDMFNKQSDKFQLYFIEFILLDYLKCILKTDIIKLSKDLLDIEILNNSIRYKNRSGYSNPLLRKLFILYNYIKIIKTLGINFEKELISLESRKIIENNSSSKELLEMDNIIKKHLEIFPDTYPL
jgi:hypothetical protein